MARVPLIDSPCPLSRAELLGIDGHCGRCDKTVHMLDGLDDSQRRALFAAAKGPLCVSYRVPIKRGPALGAAMAVMFSASAAMAGQDCDEATPVFQSVETPTAEPVLMAEAVSERLDTIVMVGGIESPENAVWTDDESLPELPIVVETATGVPVIPEDALNLDLKRR